MAHLPTLSQIQNLLKLRRNANATGPQAPCDEDVTRGNQNLRISESALSEIESAFWKYGEEVLASYLSDRAKANYIGQVEFFLRWVKGDFIPGYRKDPYPLRRKRGELPPNGNITEV
jgi:hypothetical protein